MVKAALAVYALTPPGLDLARRVARGRSARVFAPARLCAPGETGFDRFAEALAANWTRFEAHVCVAAAGLVVRACAPLLTSKLRDPAVVVLDHAGRFVVSLLSGHAGGANALARELAAGLGAQAVVTTATDSLGLPALDEAAARAGLAFEDPSRIAAVNAAVVAGGRVPVFDPANLLALPGEGACAFEWLADPSPLLAPSCGDDPGVYVDWRVLPLGPRVLALRPRCLWMGLGCRRGVDAAEVERAVSATLARCRAAGASLAGLCSVDLKRDEAGLLEAARNLGLGLRFFPADQLAAIPVPTPSERVRNRVGTASVAEAAALAATQGRLVCPKQIMGAVTTALALTPPPGAGLLPEN